MKRYVGYKKLEVVHMRTEFSSGRFWSCIVFSSNQRFGVVELSEDDMQNEFS
jgi:hypothetical protein